MRLRTAAIFFIPALILLMAGCGSPPPANDVQFTADADTVALWHFDEGSGQTVADSSVNGLDLVFGDTEIPETVDPTWVNSGRDGFGNAINVDATANVAGGQYASRDSVSGYITDQYSVEFWIKVTDATTWGTIIYLFSQISISIDPDTKMPKLSMPDGPWQDCTSSVGISDGEWHYVACTYDGAAMRIYIDGVETGSLAMSITLNPSKFYIGGHYNLYCVAAQLDEVRISDVARSADAIANYYYGATN